MGGGGGVMEFGDPEGRDEFYITSLMAVFIGLVHFTISPMFTGLVPIS